jgi:hypothetical protein
MIRREFIAGLGSAAACPIVARAQQRAAIHKMAVVHPTLSIEDLNENRGSSFFRSLFTELHRLGYVEGKI